VLGRLSGIALPLLREVDDSASRAMDVYLLRVDKCYYCILRGLRGNVEKRGDLGGLHAGVRQYMHGVQSDASSQKLPSKTR
jgi:hypothetical protein